MATPTKKIIQQGEIITDSWHTLEQGISLEALPTEGAVIVPLALWLAEEVALKARGQVGVWLAADEEAERLSGHLEGLNLIAIHFPKFEDGRGYSSARILREELGWQGEIRAIGDVLQDQLFFMQRCGFTAFEVRADREIEAALKGLRDFSVTYQTAVDQRPPLYR